MITSSFLRRVRPSALRASDSLAADSIQVILSQLVFRGGFALVTLAAARLLPIPAFTDYNLFIVNSGLIASLTSLGLPVAASLGASRYRANDQDRAALMDLRRAFVLLAAISVLQVALFPLVIDRLPNLFGHDIAYVVLGAIAANILAMLSATLSGLRDYRRLPLLVATGVAALAAGAVVAWRLGTATPLICANILYFLLPAVMIGRRLRHLGLFSSSFPELRNWSGYAAVVRIALPSFASGVLFAYSNWFISTTLLAGQTAPNMFGTYVIGMQWFALLLFVPTAIGQAAFSRFVAASAGEGLKLRSIAVPAGGAFLIGLLLCAVGALAAPLLSTAYGGRFAIDSMFVAALLFAAACSAASAVIANAVITSSGAVAWLRVNILYAGAAVLFTVLIRPGTALTAAIILACVNVLMLLGASVQLWLSLGRSTRAVRGGAAARS